MQTLKFKQFNSRKHKQPVSAETNNTSVKQTCSMLMVITIEQ